MAARVVVSARGQGDNIGDSVLRRGLLDALRPVGPMVVNVTGCPDAYVAGLGLQPQDTAVSDDRDWRSAVLDGLRGVTAVEGPVGAEAGAALIDAVLDRREELMERAADARVRPDALAARVATLARGGR